MECKLCLENGVLVRKSHIIPDFMYRDLFDNKHRLFEASLKDGALKNRRLFKQEAMNPKFYVRSVKMNVWGS